MSRHWKAFAVVCGACAFVTPPPRITVHDASLKQAWRPSHRSDLYLSGMGDVTHVHLRQECPDLGTGCVVHSPVGPPDWKTHYSSDFDCIVRVCPCGIEHLTENVPSFRGYHCANCSK